MIRAQIILSILNLPFDRRRRSRSQVPSIISYAMATALASQLAKIRTHSVNALDLKAQRRAHSQSLLFEPPVASRQDFDTIYQLCYEAFEELCRLDSRFVPFAGNIFSEHSKQEDRTQMTLAQNQELDVVIEQFLSLVGCRLLLRPALKAVEWLVRRFRLVWSELKPLELRQISHYVC